MARGKRNLPLDLDECHSVSQFSGALWGIWGETKVIPSQEKVIPSEEIESGSPWTALQKSKIVNHQSFFCIQIVTFDLRTRINEGRF